MGEMDAQLAVLKYEVANLKDEILELKRLNIETNDKLAGIVTTANKATGGFVVLVALGSVLTWGTSIGERLAKWLH